MSDEIARLKELSGIVNENFPQQSEMYHVAWGIDPAVPDRGSRVAMFRDQGEAESFAQALRSRTYNVSFPFSVGTYDDAESAIAELEQSKMIFTKK